jgi:hypothetical protein
MSSSDNTGGENKFDKFISDILDYEIKTSLKFNYDIISIHIHHWLICFFGYIIFYHINQKEFMYFCLGGMIQGIINYQDWSSILTVDPVTVENPSIIA